jgi:hypothetical protein
MKPATLTNAQAGAQIHRPQGLSSSFNGEPCMSDKLFIDLWGATISADGAFAVTAAVIVVLALFLRWPFR